MEKSGLFRRGELAERIKAELLGEDPLLETGGSGLFLAAPRRTGKTTFLLNDLIPAVEAARAVCVYVDLWSDIDRNPAELIAEAVRDKLQAVAAHWKKPAGLLSRVRKLSAKAKLAGLEAELGFEIDSVGKPAGTTLAAAFEGLEKATGDPIVFILDEAQHALSSKEGRETLFALKAARDALNLKAARPRLAILATGSVRGKLADLVNRKRQAFYGATVRDFPLLDRNFVIHLSKAMLSHRLPVSKLPDADKLMQGFDILGRRPEELRKAIASAYTRPEAGLADAVVAAAVEQRAELLGELRHRVEALLPLQRSILLHMAAEGTACRPFSSIGRYRKETGSAATTVAQVQQALGSLVRQGLVWRSSHGVYDIDDRVLADYLADAQTRAALLPAGVEGEEPEAEDEGRLPPRIRRS